MLVFRDARECDRYLSEVDGRKGKREELIWLSEGEGRPTMKSSKMTQVIRTIWT